MTELHTLSDDDLRLLILDPYSITSGDPADITELRMQAAEVLHRRGLRPYDDPMIRCRDLRGTTAPLTSSLRRPGALAG